jgi:hypothetical protein
VASSHGLSFPSALEGSEVHLPRVCRARYVPASGFGYPLAGLLPPSPCQLYFTPAALLGFALRSFLLPQGIRTFPPGRTHMPFLLPLLPSPKRTGRPGRPRLLGFGPYGSPWPPPAELARAALDAPLGFALLGLEAGTLGRFLPTLLSRASAVVLASDGSAPQSIDRRPPCLTCGGSWPQRRPGSPFRVLAPERSRHSDAPDPGYSLHLEPRRALLPTADPIRALAASCRSCRDRLRCRARDLSVA